jgi:hypothetical protein
LEMENNPTFKILKIYKKCNRFLSIYYAPPPPRL